jgi:hypothetical protein
LALSPDGFSSPGGKIGNPQTDRNFEFFHETYALFHAFIAPFSPLWRFFDLRTIS